MPTSYNKIIKYQTSRLNIQIPENWEDCIATSIMFWACQKDKSCSLSRVKIQKGRGSSRNRFELFNETAESQRSCPVGGNSKHGLSGESLKSFCGEIHRARSSSSKGRISVVVRDAISLHLLLHWLACALFPQTISYRRYLSRIFALVRV